MGNIYYEQKKYTAAIKMYRMALDQIPNTGREVRFKIMRNIGNAFVRLGQFQDAIAAYEQTIIRGQARPADGLQPRAVLLRGSASAEKHEAAASRGCCSVREIGPEDEDVARGRARRRAEGGRPQGGAALEAARQDDKYISVAAKLMAPVIEGGDIVAGFNWVVEALRAQGQSTLAVEIEISKALYFMRSKAV